MRLLSLSLILTLAVSAQTVSLMPLPRYQVIGANGVPLANGTVTTYAAGTTTPIITYTDSTGMVANANPIVLDTLGSASIWIGSQAIKIVVKDSNGVTVYTQDNISNAFNLAAPVTITGTVGTASLYVVNGYIQTNGGLLTNVQNWQAIQSLTDGALLRGLHIAQTTPAGTAGGYINIAPITYGNVPTPLAGLSSFGTHSALLWVSSSNTAQPDITNGLNTNLYISAAGGFATANQAWNSVQSFSGGGMYARSFTALKYIQTGNSNGVPSVTGLGVSPDTFNAGAMYWDTGLGSEQVFNGTAWITLGSGGGGGGGGGGAAGSTGQVQFNSGGSFAASANLTFASQLLTVTAASSGVAGIAVATGFAQADAGFLATSATCHSYTCVQAPSGGMQALSFSAANYVQLGNHSGPPSLTTGDTFNAGAIYWDTGTHGLQVRNESNAWISLSGGTGSPGSPSNSIQFNSSGSFGGDANLTYTTSVGSHLVTVTAVANTAGVDVINGYFQSDKGLLVTSSCTSINCVQALQGGMAAAAFTASNYMNSGHGPHTAGTGPSALPGDNIVQGALYWNDTTNSEQVYNGTTWVALSGGGGGGSPGGSSTAVQFNSSGSFAGDATNFSYVVTGGGSPTSRLLTVVGISGTAAIAAGAGYIQSDGGFLATAATCHSYTCVQAQTGGMQARSLTATAYVNVGQGSFSPGTGPAFTSGDPGAAGALYYNTNGSVNALQVWNGSTWVSPSAPGDMMTTDTTQTVTGVKNFSVNTNWNAPTNGVVEVTLGQNDPSHFGALSWTWASNPANATLNISTNGLSNGINYLASAHTFVAGDVYIANNLHVTGTCFGCASGGVSSLNTLTGALTVSGTANQINVSAVSNTITLSTPQNIATNSNVTFGSVTSGGVFQSQATGSSPAFQTTNFNFQVSGAGAVSAVGVISSTGAVGGFGVTGNSATNSIQTVGGVNVGSTGNSNGVYQVNGSTVINSNKQFVGFGVDVGGNGIQAGGYNIFGGFTGQTWTVIFPGGFTGIPGCASSLTFRGGVIVGCS